MQFHHRQEQFSEDQNEQKNLMKNMNEIIQAKNLFKSLIKDENSIFFSADKINKTLLKKSRKSNYDKDKVFYKIYNSLEDKEIIYEVTMKREFP